MPTHMIQQVKNVSCFIVARHLTTPFALTVSAEALDVPLRIMRVNFLMIGEILVQNELQKSLEHFLMVIGGYSYSRRSLDDVELLSLDPTAYPVPDCLTQLNPLPVPIRAAGGALDYSSIYFNETYYGKHKC